MMRLNAIWRRGVVAALLAVSIFVSLPQTSAQQKGYDASLMKGLKWRLVGPYRGGRSVAVAGVSSQPNTFYFGGTGGGIFKTTDGGNNWMPMSDGFFKTASVGAIGVSESDPNIVYVGMGEGPIRGNFSYGDGVYKTTDAGKTWKHLGLVETRQISRVRVHPKNPDIVYVGAQGHASAPNDERGVFKSTDGGATWKKILFKSNRAGVTDLILDPSNPNTIYAGIWQVERKPWTMESGGADSGLHKSTDGGETWTDISKNPGLPKGIMGNIGVTVSPLNPERLWAIIEAEDGGVFRSENGGKTWTKVNESRNLRQRAWYYTRIYADPQSADTVYVLNTSFYKSIDGGRTYSSIPVRHGDCHDLWIAPDDPKRMIMGDDGGAEVTFNGGKDWTEEDQPTAQFYRVTVDQDFPYHIYGAQQDNSTVKIASRAPGFGIDTSDWYDVGGGESGWIAPHPKDSNIVFAGSYGGLLTRYDHRTKQERNINAWPDNPMGHGAVDLKYRFQWNFPIVFSPHDANVLYAASNVIHKTTSEGQSWQEISPDLTRNDKSKQLQSGGPITKDTTSVEYYGTVFTMMESPVQKDLIWAGSDDGLVHVTRDGGKNWTNVTPPKDLMPEWIQINSLDASPFDAGTCYVAATMYKLDDFKPYLYKTTDYGKTWKKIVNGIPADAFTRVIREDPNKKGLLYAGTETGIYVSFDDGEAWQPLQLNMPVTPVTDIVAQKRDKDLIVATQGRSFYVLDDMTVLHQLADAAKADAYLFKPEEAYRFQGGGGFSAPNSTIGENPPNGVVIHYYLKNKPSDVQLEILDAAGKSIKKFASRGAAGQGAPQSAGDDFFAFFGGGGASRVAAAEAGLNRFVWDMRYADATRFPGLIMWAGSTTGPKAVPGMYQVKLTVDGKTQTQNFEIKRDPRLTTTQEDYQKQFDLLTRIRDKVTETHEAILQIRDVRKQVDEVVARTKEQTGAKAIADAAKRLNDKMKAVEEALYQTKNQSGQDPLNYPIRLNNKLAALTGVVASADAAPTEQTYKVYEYLVGEINQELAKLAEIMKTDLPAFNKVVRDQEIPAVIVKPKTTPQ
ncbi:MAG: glycosyl hydrolase [Acidobacteriota bacterium]